MKKTVFTLLGIILFFSLLCSFSASVILNPQTMQSGFETLSPDERAQAAALGAEASEYGLYAKSITDYLSGKGDMCVLPGSDGENVPAFYDTDGKNGESKQNVHMKDVRALVSALVMIRYFGCGGVLSVLAAVYLTGRARKKPFPLDAALHGFSLGALILLGVIFALAVWAVADFYGFFFTAHRILFPGNDYWMLDPSRHVLMALMPLRFFEYYAKKLLTQLLPLFGIMICLPVAYFRYKKEPEK